MPTFQTPEPILAFVEVVTGSIRLSATDRDDTVVEVRPRDPSRASDVRIAEQARVDYRNGKLTVSAGRKILSIGRGGAVEVDIALPSHSRLEASSVSAEVQADGVLGECRLSTVSGNVRLDAVDGNIKADSVSGDVSAQSVTGNASLSTASGDATIDHLDGDLKFQAASGGITVGQLRGNVTAQTASGSAAVAAAVSGGVSAKTSSGEVQVGIPHGTAARLDLSTLSGIVSNGLEASDGPSDGDETLVVHARTGSGDIMVRRATAAAI